MEMLLSIVQDTMKQEKIGGTLTMLIGAILIILIAFLLTRIIKHVAKKRFGSSVLFPVRVINSIIMIIAVLASLLQVPALKDFSVTILAGSGVAAIVLGLAAQEAVGNIICGFILAFTKPFKLGDYMELQNGTIKGVVQDMYLRHTVLKDLDNRKYIVPNSVMNKEILHSPSNEKPYVTRFLIVSVAYNADIDRAMEILAEEGGKHPDTLDVRTDEEKEQGLPEVPVRVDELASSCVMLKAFIRTSDYIVSYRVLSELRLSVLKRFKEENIEIPYPIVSVMTRTE